MLHRFAMLLKLAVRAERFLRRLFRLARGFLQRLDALVDLVELLRVIVERRQARWPISSSVR